MNALAGRRAFLRLEDAAHVQLKIRERASLDDAVRDSHETVLTWRRAPDVRTDAEELRRQGYTRLRASIGASAAEV
jgi:hypothetical protein